ncbi:hypothetical protein N2152v2_001187 [Parachlorella kessleri]
MLWTMQAEEERALGGICGNPLCEASLTDVHSSGQQPAVAGRPGGPEEEQDDDAAAGLYCCPACEAAMHSFAERLGSHPEAQHRFAVLLQQARQRRARTGARHAALRNQRHHLGAPAGVGPASTAVAVQGAQAQRQASRPLSSPFASAAGSERLVRSGRKPTARGKELPAAAIYVSLIVVANSYSQVAALLHSAISQGAANVMTTSAVFDRLRTLQAGSRRGSVEDLQAAFQVALEHALQLLPDADPRSLTALVRAAYQLGLAIPEEEQHRIVSKFIRLVRARQSPPAPKAGPPPPKPGWVQVKLPQRRPSEPPGIGKLPAHAENGASGSSKGCGADGTATAITDSGSGHSSSRGGFQQAGKASFGASHDVNHSLSVFVWAILSNPQWQLPDEQLADLMECVHLQPMDLPQDNTNILVGLVRYANTKGAAAVRPYTKEGGAAETVLNRVLLQLAVLERQDCSDTLISISKLRLRFPPGSLAALFRQALEALEEKAKQLQAVGSRSRMLDISKLFFGLSRVYDLGREECRAALDLPAARDLAQEFAEHAFYPQDYEIWVGGGYTAVV